MGRWAVTATREAARVKDPDAETATEATMHAGAS